MTLVRLDSSHQADHPDQTAELDRRHGIQTSQATTATTLSGKPITNPAVARIVPLARSVIYPVTALKAPYLTHDDLRRFRITVSPLELNGETSRGQEQFLRPLPPKKINEWLSFTQPWADDAGTSDFVSSDASWDSNYTQASFVWQCIQSHLTFDGSGSPTFVRLIDKYTRWRLFSNNHRWLHRRCDPGHNWQAEAYVRYCLPGTSTLDPSKPHINCFVGDDVPLKPDQLSTSELSSLLWLSSYAGGKMVHLQHDVIPVTLISGSGRQLRIVQGIVRFSTRSVEVRKSEIIDFEKGVKHGKNWTKFLAVLGWVVGEPVGNTQAT